MTDPTLERLLDALTTAAETGHGYLAARRAVVERFEQLRSEAVALRRALQEAKDDLADGERLR